MHLARRTSGAAAVSPELSALRAGKSPAATALATVPRSQALATSSTAVGHQGCHVRHYYWHQRLNTHTHTHTHTHTQFVLPVLSRRRRRREVWVWVVLVLKEGPQQLAPTVWLRRT